MTAAIYAAKANRSCVVLERGITGGLGNATFQIANFPSYIEVGGMELMQKVREQVNHLEVPVEEICTIERIDLHASPKIVETEDVRYEAKVVIAATGRKPIPLEAPTECEQVHYCPICDAPPYKGKKVLLVGGGNSAFDEGLYLKQVGIAEMIIVESMDRLFAAQSVQDKLLGYDDVSYRLNTEVKDLVVKGGALKAAILEDKITGEASSVEIDAVFVFLGQHPNSELFKGLLTLDKAGYIVADENMQTSIPGVFSAGDINAKTFRQLTTAAADGTIASLMADRYIRSQEPDPAAAAAARYNSNSKGYRTRAK